MIIPYNGYFISVKYMLSLFWYGKNVQPTVHKMSRNLKTNNLTGSLRQESTLDRIYMQIIPKFAIQSHTARVKKY